MVHETENVSRKKKTFLIQIGRAARSINLQNIRVRTEQASSIKILLLGLYFEIPESIVHLHARYYTDAKNGLFAPF